MLTKAIFTAIKAKKKSSKARKRGNVNIFAVEGLGELSNPIY
jgi:hypothetical protein